MAEVASAVVSLMPSFRGGKGAIAKELGGPLKGAGRDGGKTFGGGMKAGIAGMASRIFAPLAAAAGAVAIGGFFKDAIRAAGDLEQSVGAVDAVFRNSADQVLKWGKGAATSVGLSTDAYNQSAAVVGAMLTNYGVANDKVASSTNSLIGYASDLAAMFGGTTQEAVDALAAALRGEADPAEQFGLSLNKTAVNAHMAATGIDNQAAATLDLIKTQMEASGALGQFAREGETLQGAQQRLAAGWANIKASIGDLFLPAAASATGALASLLPHIQGVVDKLHTFRDSIASSGFADAMKEAFSGAGGGFDGLLAAAQAAFSQLLGWLTTGGIQSILNGLLSGRQALFDAALQLFPQILNAAMTIIPQIVSWLTGTAIPQILQVIVTTIPQIASLLATLAPKLVSTILTLLPQLMTAAVTLFTSLIDALLQVLPQLLGTLLGYLPQLLGTIMSMLPQLLQTAVTLFMSLVQALLQAIPQILLALLGMLPQLLTTILGMLPQLLKTGIQLFMSLVTAVVKILPKLIGILLGTVLPKLLSTVLGMLPELLKTGIELFFQLVTAVLKVLPKLLTTLIGTVLPQLLKTLISMVPQLLRTAIKVFMALLDALIDVLPKLLGFIFGTLIPEIVSAVLSAGGDLLSAGGEILGSLWDGIKNVWPRIASWFSSLPSRILSAIGNLGSVLWGAGSSIIQGFIDGIYSAFDSVRSTLSNLTNLLPDWKGPAERDAVLLRDAGRLVIGGFVEGMESQYADVQRSLSGLTGRLSSSVSIGASAGSPDVNVFMKVPWSSEWVRAEAETVVDGALRGVARRMSNTSVAGAY